ncbi:hypothetical protein MWU59_12020 [Flavobacteriaceae bacterium F08102]|nr:hypothetical protein [Flavobacteriaceae bacterium F08102]
MKTMFTVFLLCMSQVSYSQTNFEQAMDQAEALVKEGKLIEAANLYERISQVEPDNWLPAYHLALLKTWPTFMAADKSNVEANLELAQEYADIAEMNAPNNAEVYVLKALILVAKIAYDPATYGMTLSEKATELYQKAIALDKMNPRAQSGLIEMEMGTARYFKQDLTPYCERLQKVLKLYDAFVPGSKYHPNWGRDGVLKNLENCK